MPRAGAGEERQCQVVQGPKSIRIASAQQAQQGCASGLNDPEQIENEQDTKQVVQENENARTREMRVVDIHVPEPGDEHRISAEEQQKEKYVSSPIL